MLAVHEGPPNRLVALAFVPELSPKKQPVVNKKQLAVLSMWICGIPC